MQTLLSPECKRTESGQPCFPLLPVEDLLNVKPAAADDVSEAAAVITKPMPTACPVDRLANLHERALETLQLLKPEMLIDSESASSTKTDADAYDEYFSVVRTKGDARRIFAFGTLSAFRDLFIDMKSGTELDAVGLSSVRTAEYELLRLIAHDQDLYY